MDNTNGNFKIFYRLQGNLYLIASYSESIAHHIVEALKIKTNIPVSASRKPCVETGYYSIPPLHHNIPVFSIPFSPIESVVIHFPCTDRHAPANHKATIPARDIEKKIFIWQMGKVGSASILNSLKGSTHPTTWDVTNIVTDDHWLVHNNLLHTHSIQILYNFLHQTEEEFIVISLVRDLVARNISSVF
ncbi:MAG: hypothetical protein Q8J76_12280, partial [Desulfobulbaceae bacterium]|nr:hypothetical protein [Desulfobulbaceae bacterium]